MSKLIGTNPNQVPSNADLGSAAFMDAKDFLTARGSSLSAIDAIVPMSAVDVFVYDTSKDSDGGAWRKRCQHLSWYNEKLNTTTRGSRREFPSVAVIIMEETKVTIYDGDDSSVPMWMVFEQSGYGNMLGEADNAAVEMLNSRIVLGCSPYDLYVVDFLKDMGWSHSNASNISGTYFGNIAQRNIGTAKPDAESWSFGTVPNIIGRFVNDVAMTVLPNAPIDPATQLPIPTIAVATDGGVSVIKDDGSVVDLTFSDAGASIVAFVSDSSIVATYGSFTHILPIPEVDKTYGIRYAASVDSIAFYPPTLGYTGITAMLRPNKYNTGYGAVAHKFISPKGNVVLGTDILAKTMEGYKDTVVNIRNNYNTGWMNGGIKLATLSDTDATNVTGANLLTGDDSTFTSTVGNWRPHSDATLSVDTNRLKIQVDAVLTQGVGYITFPTVVGKTYTISLDYTKGTNTNLQLWVGTVPGSITNYNSGNITASGALTATFTASVTTTYLSLNVIEANTYAFFDNVSVRLAESDRSVNGKGLQVFGTIKKTPVAAGADLVGYSNFSTSNYMAAPASDITAPGTGNFSVMFWVYKNSNNTMRTVGWAEGATQNRFDIYLTNTGTINMYPADGGNIRQISSTLETGLWKQVVGLRENGVFKLYVDGELRGSSNDNGLFNYSTNQIFYAGCMSFDGGATMENLPLDGSLALVRVSHTAPSAEQIKKMYEDEKVLFQENAKATLYGSSDAVTALAYDDSTDLLHVGTSAGRSVFQGLRRVDNTTDAVGTAISAVNGMVVEE